MTTNFSAEDTKMNLVDVNMSTNIDSIPDDLDCSILSSSTVILASIRTPDSSRSRVLRTKPGYTTASFRCPE